MRKERARVLRNDKLAASIYSLTIRVSFAEEAAPGQFVLLYSSDESRLLPRPISICEASGKEGTLRLVFRVVGKGTLEFSRLAAGDCVTALGPVGNGFPVGSFRSKRVLLAGGGIGIPPLLGAASCLEHPLFAVGYRSEPYLLEDLRALCEVWVATEDGSLGTKGTVLDAIEEGQKASGSLPDAVFACGPLPMLKALAGYFGEKGVPLYVSMEERMACGIGACLGCVTRTVETDSHSKVHNARICRDGPVFLASEVDWS